MPNKNDFHVTYPSINDDELSMEEFEKLQNSLDEIPVPSSLEPDQVIAKLKNQQQQKDAYTKARKRILRTRITAIAASFAIVIGTGFAWKAINDARIASRRYTPSASAFSTEAISPEATIIAKTEKLGDSLRLAKDYKDIDSCISDYSRSYLYKESLFDKMIDSIEPLYDSNATSAAIDDVVESESSSAVNNAGSFTEDIDAMEDAGASDSSDSSHSTTNVQTEGVAEGDYVVTDGEYLYYLYSNKVSIFAVNNKLRAMSTITQEDLTVSKEKNTSLFFRELYIANNNLYIVAEKFYEDNTNGYSRPDVIYYDGDWSYNYYGYNTKAKTFVFTYDLSDIEKPQLASTLSQDGFYKTSRLAGSFLYLFTNYTVYLEEDNYTYKDYVPEINDSCISYDCFYIENDSQNELVMSSIELNNPSRAYDTLVVLGDNYNLYMGADKFYLYKPWNDSYRDSDYGTEISSFTYKDGHLNGVANGKVLGNINDSFAIHEGNGFLQVLTTFTERRNNLTNGVTSSRVFSTYSIFYNLDENLDVAGRVSNIAVGESVYAARFLGTRGYFVTYLNHDPVFVVDYSDPYNPQLLGNIEISGYSDYLHAYNKDMILGLGYETDEETSAVYGIKVSMFDFSDPLNPYTIDTNTTTCKAYSSFDNYKSLLIDPQRNLIGFAYDSYNNDEWGEYYNLYTWKEDHFELLLQEEFGFNDYDGYYSENVGRGMYVNDIFFLIRGSSIQAFDMKNNYKKLASVSVKP